MPRHVDTIIKFPDLGGYERRWETAQPPASPLAKEHVDTPTPQERHTLPRAICDYKTLSLPKARRRNKTLLMCGLSPTHQEPRIDDKAIAVRCQPDVGALAKNIAGCFVHTRCRFGCSVGGSARL